MNKISFGNLRMVSIAPGIGLAMLGGLLFLLSLHSWPAFADPGELFVAPGGSGIECSQATPCDLQTALAQAQGGDVIYLAQGTYTGTGAAVVTLTKGITLYGGGDGSPTGPVVRDPQAYQTVLDGEGVRRVIFITGTITPTIDGFVITGGNATGLGGSLFGSDSGGGIYSYAAAPVIQNNIITGNIASTQAGMRAMGGGIYIQSVNGTALICGNRIISNAAGIGVQQAEGGGIFLYGPAQVQGNHFEKNVACRGCSHAYGGGASVGWTKVGAEIVDNVFVDNQASGGGGVYLVWSAARVAGNTLYNNRADRGGGLYSYYDSGSLVEANEVISNTASLKGGGVALYITVGDAQPQVINNVIARNEAAVYGGGFYAASDWHVSYVTFTHNTLVDNGEGVVAGRNMTITMVNNILVSHTIGISLEDSSGHVFPDYTLFWANSNDGIRGTHPVDGAPAFVDPGSDDYHLGPGSAAIDAGVDAGVTTDIDGDPRPLGSAPDIGADEFVARVYLPLVVKEAQPSTAHPQKRAASRPYGGCVP